jgi:hypothetical protein
MDNNRLYQNNKRRHNQRSGEVNEEKRGGRMGYYLDILRRREKCKNNDMSPELYEEEKNERRN